MKRVFTGYLLLSLALAAFSSLEASRRRTDFTSGTALPTQDNPLPSNTRTPEASTLFSTTPKTMQDWGSSSKRFNQVDSRYSTESDEYTYESKEVKRKDFKFSEARVSTSSARTSKDEVYTDWNVVRDNVMASRYEKTSPMSSDTKNAEGFTDQISLRSINRFASLRNKAEPLPISFPESSNDDAQFFTQGYEAQVQSETDTVNGIRIDRSTERVVPSWASESDSGVLKGTAPQSGLQGSPASDAQTERLPSDGLQQSDARPVSKAPAALPAPSNGDRPSVTPLRNSRIQVRVKDAEE